MAISVAAVAQAQDARQNRGGFLGGGPGGFMGGGASGADLLGSPEVQKELSVTDEQKGLIEDMVADLREQRRSSFSGGGGFQGFQNLSQEERQKLFDEMRKKGEELTKKSDEMVNMILEPKQADRLNQLKIQRAGAGAFAMPDIQKKLGLTDDQKENVRKILEEARPQFDGQAFRGFQNFQNLSEEERQQAINKAREEGEKIQQRFEKAKTDLIALLTADQKTTWEKVIGKKFDFAQPPGFGGGRRPGGPGGGEGQPRRPDTKKDDK